jgi:hypothetical protein
LKWWYATFGTSVNFVTIANEVLHTNPPPLAAALGGPGMTGYDWVLRAFQLARQYMPGVKLGINDYNVELNDHQPWDPGETTRYINLIRLLVNGNLLDWIGCEGDFLESASPDDLKTAMHRLGAFGLPIYITECTISDQNDQQQLIDIQNVFIPLWQSPYVFGFSFWDVYQNYGGSRPDDWLENSDGSHRPAFDWLIGYVPSSDPPLIGTSTPSSAPVAAPDSVAPPEVTFVQGAYSTPQSSVAAVSVPFSDPQAAGCTNIVVVGWNDGTHEINAVTDANGNAYSLAAPVTRHADGGLSQAIYFSPDIKGGPNSVLVTFSGAVPFADIRIASYSGIRNLGVSSSAIGSGLDPSSGAINLTSPGFVISAVTTTGGVSRSGSGFNSRLLTYPDADLLQDRMVTEQSGPQSDRAHLGANAPWVSQLVTFD